MNISVNETIYLPFNTVNSTGAAVEPSDDIEDSDIKIIKDGSTVRSSAAGIAVSSPFGTEVGSHLISIDTSDNTDPGFWEAGSHYVVQLNTIKTADGVSLDGLFIPNGCFGIEYEYMRGTDSANTTAPPTAAAIRSEMDSNSTQLTAILADTDDLQTNQGNWLTATGFATPANVTGAQMAIISHGDSNWPTATGFATPLNITDARDAVITQGDTAWATATGFGTPADITAAQSAIIAHGDGNWPTATGFSTFNPATDQVIVATNNDKTGYSLTQAFPTNFASMAITVAGEVTAVGGGGSGGTVLIGPLLPAQLPRIEGTDLTAYTGESPTYSVPIVDATGAVVDPTGLDMYIVVKSKDQSTNIAVLENNAITKAPEGITFTMPIASTQEVGIFHWACRLNESDEEGDVLLEGQYAVNYAASRNQ